MVATAPLKPVTQLDTSGEHLIGSVEGSLPGPTLVILGGIHGNEPAGVLAAERVLPHIQEGKAHLRGQIVFLRGNTRALARRVRFIDADLNRQWSAASARIAESAKDFSSQVSELVEQSELLGALKEVIERARGDVYFLDLHTTSAHGNPFATVGDTLRNRRFAQHFPVTIVLGLEEQIDGTLLEYVNNLGAVTMGFEAGQHEAPTSVDHHEAVIWTAAVASGNFDRDDVLKFDHWQSLLTLAGGGKRVVEVRHRHAIVPGDEFRMALGFRNFQSVCRGRLLATDRSGQIEACETGFILMPLYQKQGDDGFFLGRDVKKFWLRLSALLRHLKVGTFMHLLPGVRRDPIDKNVLIINTRIARIMPLQIFHLLGFRKRRWTDNDLIVSRRSYDLAGPKKLIF
jgi:succinylglutamate desuccinylase